MKAKKIIYERLFNLGDYQHEKIGIELEIEEGEKASDVFEKAKQFVNRLNPNDELKRKYERSKEIVNNAERFFYNDVKNATEFIEEYEKGKDKPDDLPF